MFLWGNPPLSLTCTPVNDFDKWKLHSTFLSEMNCSLLMVEVHHSCITYMCIHTYHVIYVTYTLHVCTYNDVSWSLTTESQNANTFIIIMNSSFKWKSTSKNSDRCLPTWLYIQMTVEVHIYMHVLTEKIKQWISIRIELWTHLIDTYLGIYPFVWLHYLVPPFGGKQIFLPLSDWATHHTQGRSLAISCNGGGCPPHNMPFG